MTQQEQIEIIQVQFPQAGETRLRKMLNVANNKFTDATRIIQGVATTTSVKDQKYYNFSDFTLDGGELRKIKSLRVEDNTDNPFIVYWVEDINSRIGIGQEEGFGGRVIPIGMDGLTIQVHGIFGDTGYGTTLTEEPAYDNAFHMAIVYDVLNDLHSEQGNIDMSRHYHNKYRELEIAAKRYVGSSGIKGNYQIEGQSNRRVKGRVYDPS